MEYEKLKIAVKDNYSMRATLKALKMYPQGGNYLNLKRHIVKWNLDISHWTGKSNSQHHRKSFIKIPIKQVLVENSTYSGSSTLKIRLFQEQLLENKCEICGQLPEWNGKSLALQLDHVNGVNNDNRLENLRILCPHCHSQTETFCRGVRRTSVYHCKDCKTIVNKRSIRCIPCNQTYLKENFMKCKIQWPLVEDLISMVTETSYRAAAKTLGVSDNAVRNCIKKGGGILP